MTQQPYDANAVLMGAGGAPAASFPNPGDTWEGKLVSPPIARQEQDYDPNNPGAGKPKVFPSGDPIMGVLVDIATNMRDASIENDDGTRRLYIEGRYLKAAVRDAVRVAGASGLEVGGHLKITFTHREDPADKRSRKFWQVTYTPAANAALMSDPTPVAQQAPTGWQTPPATPPPAWTPPPAAPPVQAAPAPAATAPPSAEQLAAYQAYVASQQQNA